MAMFLDGKGKLSWTQPSAAAFDEYVADPNKPVPYLGRVIPTVVLNSYMTEDQRFASMRPDVLVYKTEPLDHDVTVYGPITVDLKVSTTGTDSDFVVKVIDVYPGDYPDYDAPPVVPGAPPAPPPLVPMGGYQQLIRGEPFRGKYRKSFEKPVPFEPGKPDHIIYKLPDVAHTFREGHRIMVQIQSSWFPLTDRNPQKFMDIPKALATDFEGDAARLFRRGRWIEDTVCGRSLEKTRQEGSPGMKRQWLLPGRQVRGGRRNLLCACTPPPAGWHGMSPGREYLHYGYWGSAGLKCGIMRGKHASARRTTLPLAGRGTEINTRSVMGWKRCLIGLKIDRIASIEDPADGHQGRSVHVERQRFVAGFDRRPFSGCRCLRLS